MDSGVPPSVVVLGEVGGELRREAAGARISILGREPVAETVSRRSEGRWC